MQAGCCFGCLLIFVWLFNTEQPWQHKLLGLVVICLLCFLLEGVELAFTELHDKDSERLPDNIKGVVAEVNRRRAEFYDARELLVVILLVSITILSDNTKISLPIIGPTSDRRWTLGIQPGIYIIDCHLAGARTLKDVGDYELGCVSALLRVPVPVAATD